jgi:hypothetical protein
VEGWEAEVKRVEMGEVIAACEEGLRLDLRFLSPYTSYLHA